MKLVARELSAGPWPGGTFQLEPLGFDLEAPGRLALIGPNGSGKSTLLRRLAGVLPGGGSVRLDGATVEELKPRERARRMCLLAQSEDAPQGMSVLEYVSLARFPWRSMLELSGRRDRDAAREALDRCGVAGFGNRLLAELSGGERQLVRIAAALAQQVRVLLLDEPGTFLDPGRSLRLQSLLDDLVAEREMILIWVCHDLNEVLARECRVMALDEGRLLWSGSSAELGGQDWLESLYECRFERGPGPGVNWLIPRVAR